MILRRLFVLLWFFIFTSIQLESQTSVILDIQWHPDGTTIASVNSIGLVEVTDLQTGQVIFTASPLTGLDLLYGAVDWNSDGTQLAVGIERYVYIWTTVPNYTLTQTLVAGSSDGIVISEAGSLVENIFGLEWSPDETQLYTESLAVTTIWDTASFTPNSVIHGVGPSPRSWKSDSTILSNGQVELLPTTNSLIELNGTKLTGYYTRGSVLSSAIAWKPDDTEIVFGTVFGNITVVDANTGNELLYFDEHSNVITEIKWHPTANIIASSDLDGKLLIWEPDTRNIVETIQSPNALETVDWSPDGTQLAYAGENGVVEIIDVSVISVASLNITDAITCSDE